MRSMDDKWMTSVKKEKSLSNLTAHFWISTYPSLDCDKHVTNARDRLSSLRNDVSVESFPPSQEEERKKKVEREREGEDEENNMKAADVTGLYRRMLRHICQSLLALCEFGSVTLSVWKLIDLERSKRFNTCFCSFIMKPVERRLAKDATRKRGWDTLIEDDD